MKETLVAHYQQTLEDFVFTRGEKKALKAILKANQVSDRDRDYLRSQIFDMAHQAVKTHPAAKVLEWLEVANKTLVNRQEALVADTSVYFSPGDHCLDAINQQLKLATKQVKICVFTISDDRISREILNCHERGVSVQIITDNDKSNDAGSDIYRLGREGVPIKMDQTPHHMHHKFAIFDQKTLLTGVTTGPAVRPSIIKKTFF